VQVLYVVFQAVISMWPTIRCSTGNLTALRIGLVFQSSSRGWEAAARFAGRVDHRPAKKKLGNMRACECGVLLIREGGDSDDGRL
jgi:hypothetical protein